ALRDSGFTLPILMIAAHDTPDIEARGLRSGADDCLGKPFSRVELLARIDALLRRSAWDKSRKVHKIGNVEIDFRTGSVFRLGKRVEISEREFAILRYLVENAGEVVSRDQLL